MPAPRETSSAHATDTWPIALAAQDWSFHGGGYIDTKDGTFFSGGLYVERYVPAEQRHPHPVVMIHGGGQTGTNFTATPDGRRGWLHDFLRAGYAVHIVDQPERGRSGHAAGVYGQAATLQRSSVKRIEDRFTAPAQAKLWPQSARHTRWPGTGRKGDPAFDRFYASQVEGLRDGGAIEALNRDAGVALLDAIGPAILMTHSQSGPLGWLIADARPELVKGILALEPNGPPFSDVEFVGGETWHRYVEGMARPWGITRLPLTYDPPAARPEDLRPTADPKPAGTNLVAGLLQGGTPRRLSRLAGIPILILATEASYHATYDHATSRFLEQAGVAHDFYRLEDKGLAGNGHMAMLETNNHAVADLMIDWLARQPAG